MSIIYKKEDMSKVQSYTVPYHGLVDKDRYNYRLKKFELPDGNIEYYNENTVIYSSVFDYYKTGESSMYIDAIDIYR